MHTARTRLRARTGLVAGIACCGAFVPTVGSGVRRVGALAAALCASGPLLALALLLVGPAAYRSTGNDAEPSQSSGSDVAGSTVAAAEAAAVAFRSGGEMLDALAAGWSAYAGASLLLPQARAWSPRRAGAGFVLGAVLAAAVAASCAALCVATPYCLQQHTS